VREERQALNNRDDFIRGSMPSDAHLNLNHQSASTTVHSLPQGGWEDRVNSVSGESEVGFRMEDTLKALSVRDKTSQYLSEPSLLGSYPLKTRSAITTTSASTREHLIATANRAKSDSNFTSSSRALVLGHDPNHNTSSSSSSSSSSYPIHATGLSHPRILQGVPTGLMPLPSSSSHGDSSSSINNGGNYYSSVSFTSVDGSAQRSLAAQRSAQLGLTSDVIALPRRFDPKSCDFDVKNLYNTSS
jgi:hypothetical protein